MVLIDSSIWINLYRKKTHHIGELVWSLVANNKAAICGQILVEFLGGFRTALEWETNKKALELFPFLETTKETYMLASNLLAKYPKLGPGDVIIGATAITNSVKLLTFDNDFQLLKSEGLELLQKK
ncbi:MAG: PIN domain-containing protein [Deltaproteobacteria bacterium]|nr:PIN domain-containing protein [Deltaproteobacteria bacterium]MBI5139647.1 PIN domain-containing protein [Candidatus Nomurabacteria bacterium]